MKSFFMCLLFFLFSNNFSTAQVTSFNIDSTKLDKPLMKILDSLYKEDQEPRNKFIKSKLNKASANETDSLWRIVLKKDQQNIHLVDSIVTKYGWLGPQKVGFNGSMALFLVIQHTRLSTQRRYLPMIVAAERNGEILSSNLAILEDRINMREGKKQIYGSQQLEDKLTGKMYIYPILEPEHLDERRKNMGMPPMNTYIKNWNLENYERDLPNIEKVVKELLKKQ